MTEIHILKAGLHHADLIAKLQSYSFTSAWSALDIQEILKNKACCALIAHTATQQPIGFVLSYIHPGESEILSIGVLSAYRRQRVATSLLQKLISECRLYQSFRLFLEVDALNSAAITLYQKYGFDHIGTRPNYYRDSDGPRRDAYIYRKLIS